MYDGIGVAVRRLSAGRFMWSLAGMDTRSITRALFDALVIGLTWQRACEAGIITVL